MPADDARTSSFKEGTLKAIPSLRAFAYTLSKTADRADDLVQETILRALAHADAFEPGTNMTAWLFTILRNIFRSQYHKRKREVEDTEGTYAATLIIEPEQEGKIELIEFHSALQMLPEEQREAVILTGASGFSYEEIAEICGCKVGTVKSRVSRGRERLIEILEGDTKKSLLTGRLPESTVIPPAPVPPPRPPRPSRPICSLCWRPVQGVGLCAMHYRRRRLYGDPNITMRAPKKPECVEAAEDAP